MPATIRASALIGSRKARRAGCQVVPSANADVADDRLNRPEVSDRFRTPAHAARGNGADRHFAGRPAWAQPARRFKTDVRAGPGEWHWKSRREADDDAARPGAWLQVSDAGGGLHMLTLAALLVGSAYLTREHMIRDRVTKLQAVVEIAGTVATLLEADVDANRITQAQAIERFRKFVYAARYNGADYLFAHHLDGTVIALGNDPEAQGQSHLGLRDVKGTLFVQKMLAAAGSGGGTVTYWYPRRPGETPVPKLAYVKDFSPWNMLIGSGVCVGDIDAAFSAYLGEVAVVLLLALAVAGGLAFWIGRQEGQPACDSPHRGNSSAARRCGHQHYSRLAWTCLAPHHEHLRGNRSPNQGPRARLMCSRGGGDYRNNALAEAPGRDGVPAVAVAAPLCGGPSAS